VSFWHGRAISRFCVQAITKVIVSSLASMVLSVPTISSQA